MDTVWALVEWVDDSNVFPSYGVVNYNAYSYQESDHQPGKQILISLKNGDPRRAKIIRISDNKRQVKEHKDFLERQDQQVKNVLQLCMRTIKEMKSDQYSNSMANSFSTNMNGSHGGLPRVITANDESSMSDSDMEVPQKAHGNNITKLNSQSHHQNVRYDPSSLKKRTPTLALNLRRRSVVNSTPIPGKCVPENIKLFFDQGTQTDNEWLPISKIEEIELVLHHLYGRFQSLVMRVNGATVSNENIIMSESEQNAEASYVLVEPNESWVVTNDIDENAVLGYNGQESNIPGDVGPEHIAENENHSVNVHINKSVKIETIHKKPNESTRVRRMSAQTTYSNEMVPIGNGRAMVPARLLNDINWSSYTIATRQLLQAIFPRKVLATHSLTGKPSPAHLNKPPKKLLDPNLVEDIIITVSSKCAVAKNLVRNSITIKCTDEAKLYRNRQQYQLSRSQLKSKQNEENVPPTTAHSSE